MNRYLVMGWIRGVTLLGFAACTTDNLPGKCRSQQDCQGGGKCEAGLCVLHAVACEPESVAEHCQSTGKTCGPETWTDKCGKERSESCGICPNCTPETDAEHCQSAGLSCGSASWKDKCGNDRKTDSCGTCRLPQVCGGDTSGKCGCDRSTRPAPTDWTRWPAIPIPPPKSAYLFVVNGSMLDVLDSQTCLIWQYDVQTNPSPHSGDTNWQDFTWKEARDYCASHGWRLPTKIELGSIIDYSGTTGPAMNKDFFGQPRAGPGGGFWSATPYMDGKFVSDGSAGLAWVVGFGSGCSNCAGVGNTAFVRCVR